MPNRPRKQVSIRTHHRHRQLDPVVLHGATYSRVPGASQRTVFVASVWGRQTDRWTGSLWQMSHIPSFHRADYF